jgi:hypothetical protein
MESSGKQVAFFQHIKAFLQPQKSLVDEVADLLFISTDSAYRRIRGETPISLEEIQKLASHYRISLDQLLQIQNDSVIFTAPGLLDPGDDFHYYLTGILKQFKYFNSFKTAELKYLCKDIPLWYLYLFPEFGAFKTFFFSKTMYNNPGLTDKKFSLEEFSFGNCFTLGQEILEEHSKLHSVELWNLESINSAINQIGYYKDVGNFKSHNDLIAVINSFIQMLTHLEHQAEEGVKFMPGAADVSYKGPIQFYVNELVLGNNTVLLTLDGKRTSMITYGVFSYLITRDDRFSDKAFYIFDSLLSRSALISKTGEKDRKRFFNTLRDKVNALKK